MEFPDNKYMYKFCPKYLQSFNKFCAEVKEAASKFWLPTVHYNIQNRTKFKFIRVEFPRKRKELKFPGNMHIYALSLIPMKFNEILCSSLRWVTLTKNRTDWWSDWPVKNTIPLTTLLHWLKLHALDCLSL